MPSSAQIYGTLALPGKETGLATLGDLAAMRDVQAQRQAQAQKAQADAEKVAREQQQAQMIQSAVQKHTRPDGTIARTALLDDVMGIDIDAGQKLAASLSKMDLDASNARKGELENEDKLWSQSARWLQPLNEKNAPALFPSVKARISSLDPELGSILGDTYDPERVKAVIGMGTDRTEYNKEYKAILDEKNDAKTTALKLLSIAKSPEHVQDAFEYADHHDITGNLLEMGFTPDAPDVSERALAFLGGTKAPSQGAFQSQERIVNGKPQVVNFDPHTGQYTDQSGQPVSVAPIPPKPSTGANGLGGTPENAKLIAQSIIAGRQPPELTGLYGNTDDVRAELERQGYDLTRARQDWQATQKQLATLNGAQQTRLRQAVTFTKDSLDIVQGLANEWKGGRFPILNKLNLSAAKNGVYGQDVQSVASRLDAQINDIVSELGTVYKGGNSSTDHSLQLAAENLKSNWSQKTMTDAINLIRKNLQIRENSINNTVAVANAGNPYAPNLGGGSGGNAKDPMGIR